MPKTRPEIRRQRYLRGSQLAALTVAGGVGIAAPKWARIDHSGLATLPAPRRAVLA
jgi:hypothetical protein